MQQAYANLSIPTDAAERAAQAILAIAESGSC